LSVNPIARAYRSIGSLRNIEEDERFAKLHVAPSQEDHSWISRRENIAFQLVIGEGTGNLRLLQSKA